MSERQLQKWFKQNIREGGVPYQLDRHQAKIVLDRHKNTLVTARAGSGKTRTIVAKIIYLLTYQQIASEEIIVFAFNRKAAKEINERLTRISYKMSPLFEKTPKIATTFHAFAYRLYDDNKLHAKIISEQESNGILESLKVAKEQRPTVLQFINRAEQQFFQDYKTMQDRIEKIDNHSTKTELKALEKIFFCYKKIAAEHHKISFNELISNSYKKLPENTPYKYIFIDEYQDFSLLFQTLIISLRKTCPAANLLAVGDDWQAINRFAGSDVNFFLHFEQFFPEDHIKLFIPTNYRSSKTIVKNANYFMSKTIGDYKGCSSGNRIKSKIYLCNTKLFRPSELSDKTPSEIQKYVSIIQSIIKQNREKSIKILSRNNNLSINNWTTEKLVTTFFKEYKNISFSTIHRSKGLEADVIILLEIDDDKFPGPSKNAAAFQIFGDSQEIHYKDEARLFYVALTRAKEKLYILSKSTKITKENRRSNFLAKLNENWLYPFL